MGTTLNKKTYTKLIEENIAEMEKYMPEHSLEKQHAIDVLKWSINAIYESEEEKLKKSIEFASAYPDEFRQKQTNELKSQLEAAQKEADVHFQESERLRGEKSILITANVKLQMELQESKAEVERLKNLLEDVVNELDLSESAIEKHGPLGTKPSELVRLVLEQKNLEITMLKAGMKHIKPQ